MTPVERRELLRLQRELRQTLATLDASLLRPGWQPAARERVAGHRERVAESLAKIDRLLFDSPRPSWWLRVRLRLRGVRAG